MADAAPDIEQPNARLEREFAAHLVRFGDVDARGGRNVVNHDADALWVFGDSMQFFLQDFNDTLRDAVHDHHVVHLDHGEVTRIHSFRTASREDFFCHRLRIHRLTSVLK